MYVKTLTPQEYLEQLPVIPLLHTYNGHTGLLSVFEDEPAPQPNPDADRARSALQEALDAIAEIDALLS